MTDIQEQFVKLEKEFQQEIALQKRFYESEIELLKSRFEYEKEKLKVEYNNDTIIVENTSDTHKFLIYPKIFKSKTNRQKIKITYI